MKSVEYIPLNTFWMETRLTRAVRPNPEDGLVLRAGDGGEQLLGHDLEDRLYGGTGSDTLQGGSGSDLLVGGDGADSLRGDNGDDTLYGNDGNDILEGGNGADSLSGGAGADLFVWRNSNDSAPNSDWDVVHDFTPGEDRLGFSDLQDDLVFVTTPTGQAGQVWFDDRSSRVSIDLTGSGGADVSIHLIGVTDLNEGDFLF